METGTLAAITIIIILGMIIGSLLTGYYIDNSTPKKTYCTSLGNALNKDTTPEQIKIQLLSNFTKNCGVGN